ncbi:uncharacterized protein [Montipora capricornis]|uniref:uncharacterized protein isoform X2 n=1 Tax=Montipora capricornis TaxID=246305 RepID=UPI0035F150EE
MWKSDAAIVAKDMKTLFVFSIFVVICQIINKTETQQCPTVGSEESILGWMLQGHIYQTMMASIGLHCLSACLKDDRCQSFNFVISLHMCEFSDRTKEARPEDFVPDADRYYFRKYTNRAPLGSISELASESCKEIKMSEGRSPNGKYWMSSVKPGIPVLAFCDMKTEDVDECTASLPVCHENATCNNTLGSYQCTCKAGYAGDGKTCRDVDECTASSPVCHEHATCNNTLGSYQCTCKAGYAGDGKTCRDVDECTASSPVCHEHATCNNTLGSYQCTCKAGYAGDGKTCRDVDECTASSPVCHEHATCNNTLGSYQCTCKPGYAGDGKTCRVPLPSSNILGNLDGKYLVKLNSFLVPVLQSSSRSRFVKCWRAKTDGWAASTFHSNCDGKGPTVTIIKVGSYIFGGYTDLSWYSSSCGYASSSKSFIYSLQNINGYAPIKLQVKSGRQHYAIYRCSNYGPTFGPGDIYISNNAASNQESYTWCGFSYPLPPGYYSSSYSCRFYAGSYKFTPTDIEVFYETTT